MIFISVVAAFLFTAVSLWAHLPEEYSQDCNAPILYGGFYDPPGISRADDPVYHNNDRILRRLLALRDSMAVVNPNWFRFDSIGVSLEGRPIWCVRIGNNVNDSLSEKPAVLLVGQVHAEEILGVEYVMRMIPAVIGNRNWRQNVDTYIVPTTNPDGLHIVYTLDYTYRKNTRDNIGDGRFRYKLGWGQDTSGVDLNRNYPLFWQLGTALLVSGDNEFFDYYRGPGPASEPETKLLIALVDRIRPLYSCVIHSSRTGNVAQQVIYPWSYAPRDLVDKKTSPDILAFDALGSEIALRCKRYAEPIKTYEPVRIVLPRGDSESYFYWKYGAFAFRIEIGAAGEAMQPDSAGVYSVLSDVRLGIEYFLNSAANVASDGQGPIIRNRMNLRVTDQVTGAPLEARLHIPSLSRPIYPYRKTNPVNGRAFWPVYDGFIDTSGLTVRKFGYRPFLRRPIQGSIDRAPIQVRLVPLPVRNVRLEFTTGGTPLPDGATAWFDHPDSSWQMTTASGRIDLSLPEGDYQVTVAGLRSIVPRRTAFTVLSDTTYHIGLSPAAILLDQSFDGGDVVYMSDHRLNTSGLDSLSRWELTEIVYRTPPRAFTDTRTGNTLRNEDSWGAPYNFFDGGFNLAACSTAALTYWLNQALEPGYDSMWVEVSTGGLAGSDPAGWTWIQAAPAHMEQSVLDSIPPRPWNARSIRLQRWGRWKQFVVPLDAWCGEPVVHFRFHLRSDNYTEEDGVTIDDVALFASTERPPEVSADPLLPRAFALDEPYPNPFNGLTTIRVAMPSDGLFRGAVYDLQGRQAFDLGKPSFSAGSHLVSLDLGSLPAGLYLLRATGPDGRTITHKLALVK
ncbi:MAG: T9SS type A sorting domain-containing protein [Calditrichaeota bacterium]|nr:T9SS type A sorting domain-containing protein [Calditrichota bacterium]